MEITEMKEAIKQAKRCLNCKVPMCKKGCPIENDIPDFIHEVTLGNFGEAREILARKTNLPAVCGRVCPHEKQCQGNCVMGKKGTPVQIGALERFVADFNYEVGLTVEKIAPKTRGKVAVIGSGPAGLTVAGDLAKDGFSVTVYEGQEEPGGVLLFGIPEYRLPKDVVRREIKRIEHLGVEFKCNTLVGVDITLDEIMAQGFDAAFIGTGTALANTLKVPGKDLNGIKQAIHFLRKVTLYQGGTIDRDDVLVKDGDTVLVIGAGNVAMDAARQSLRMGAKEVKVIYRRKEENMPATQAEYHEALEEGVQFIFETDTYEYVGDSDGNVVGIRAHQGEEDVFIPCDKVLVAIGQRPASRIVSTTKGIETDAKGYIITKEKPYGMTTLKGVFSGGDVVHQPATVVLAMREAKRVAQGIEQYIDAVKLLEL